MGNYSRNTFNPNKNYVAVRLQQGVPLVDADWNELNDITRNELYNGMEIAFPDGVPPGSNELKILNSTIGASNDFLMNSGSALIKGRPLRIRSVRYIDQPWIDPVRAHRDGVALIPPLTTPAANRKDIVYLDIWEREVGSSEDTNLINPAIGIETCVRWRREAAVRVDEGRITLPVPPSGHFFMPLALLNRMAGQATITSDQIVDIRPFLHSTKGIREVSIPPIFLPVSMAGGNYVLVYDPWMSFSNATKQPQKDAYGCIPLTIPDGAYINILKIQGATYGPVRFILRRYMHGFSQSLLLADVIVQPQTPGGHKQINLSVSILSPSDERINLVDNSRFYYIFYATAVNTSATGNFWASISGISIQYSY